MRKGLYNALFGIAVAEDRIALDATLAELGIDDLQGLTAAERAATVEDLLTSRSGVYHPAAYEPSSMKRERPARGSHPRGTFWFYNNWDFNTAAHLVARATGESVFDLFAERIAAPLGMEDFALDDTFSFWEPSHSRYAAPLFRMSARDLARFGLLYLRGGEWNGSRILDPAWIERSWRLHTAFDEGSRYGAGNGFGYLWWIHPGQEDAATAFERRDVYLTRGSDGQVLAVVPAMALVVVHQTDSENGREVGFTAAVELIDRILRAYGGSGSSEVLTTDLRPQPLPNPAPAPVRRKAIPWTPESIGGFIGAWIGARGVRIEVHSVEGRLFALPINAPLAEVELFAESPDRLFSPAVDLLLDVVRDGSGRALKLVGRVDGIEMEIVREP
jgi:hypothetical protein